MCSGSPVVFTSQRQRQRQQQEQKKTKVSVILRRKRLRLTRRRRRRAAWAEVELLNLKLHLENRRILVQNERLREKAGALRRENLALPLRANLWERVVASTELTEVAQGC